MGNGCSDATASVARRAGAVVVECPSWAGGVGAARRVGMALARRLAPDAAFIVTTDADCTLGPSALAVLAAALRRADAAFGRVVPHPDEFAARPADVRAHGDLEDLRGALTAATGGRAAPADHNPAPRHGQAPDALMAFRATAYDAVGCFDPVPCGEDRAIAARLRRAGFRVAQPWGAVVVASCRLDGRAPGGMADTIAQRTRADLVRETDRMRVQTKGLARLAAALGAEGPAAFDRLVTLAAPAAAARLRGGR